MQYNTKDIVELTDAKFRFRKLIEQGKTIELKGLSDNRTAKQNRALHKFFVLVSDQLNEMGLEFQYIGLKGDTLGTRYSPNIVKEYFWRPIQIALFNIESTKDIDTKQINEVVDVISKFFGDKGVVIEFPSIEQLINKI